MSSTKRSRMGLGAGALVALCLSTAVAFAQDRPVTTRADHADSVKIHASGRLNLDYVVRSQGLMATGAMNGNSTGSGGEEGNNSIEGEVSIRLDAELSEKISLVVEIARERADLDGAPGGVMSFTGESAQGFDGAAIALSEAHLLVKDFLAQGLAMQLGILTWDFKPRAKSGGLMFDLRNSENMARNFDLNQLTTADLVASYGTSETFDLEPMGASFNYSSGSIALDVVFLPMVIEGGSPTLDESLYAVDLWYKLDEQMGKGSRVGAILALSHLGTLGVSESQVITFGVAGDLMFSGGFEVYFEGYVQTGTISTLGAADLDAKGHALTIGAQYNVQGDNNLWIGASFTVISGDSDTGVDTEVDAFMSYEGVNDFLVIENGYFGLDIDTNLTAIKIMAGVALDLAGGKKNLELEVGLGIFTATEDVVTAAGLEDGWGNEVDVKGRWHLNKQVALVLQIGILFGSDLVEQMGGGAAALDSDDGAFVASFGFDGRF